MSQDNFSFINRAVDTIYSTGSNEEAEKIIKNDVPQYDPCDTTLSTQYDTKFKDNHSDKGVPDIGNFCLDRPEKRIIRDLPFEPAEYQCCCNVVPAKETPFVRPTAEQCVKDTFKCIPCDSRIPTITTGHYAHTERDAQANEFFNKEHTFEGTMPTHNHYVSQPNVNEESNSNSVGSDDGTPVIEGNVVPTENTEEEPIPEV